jgi:hypothetical protein
MDLKPILKAILDEYVLPWDGDHGVAHWARVLENGRRLAEQTSANVEIVMRKVQMTTHELESSLRAEGCVGPEEVRFAVLENNGHVTVIPMDETKS